MTEPLDVLLVESHRHASDAAAAELEHAGHRVHRCFDDGSGGFPCRGVGDPRTCPIDTPIDVALVVRRRLAARPTPLEQGVSCALRAGVPIIEQGSDVLDPFAPYITARISFVDDVVDACRTAADHRYHPLHLRIADRIAALVHAAGLDPAAVHCRIEAGRTSLGIHLALPAPVGRALEQALAVRVLDAVRAEDRTFGRIDVHVHTPDEAGGVTQ